MSGIAAVIRFDGGPIEPGTVERMTAAMDYRGPDGITHWQRGSVALGHCMMHTTTESLEEVQPLANEDESLVLVMDGWLSNWVELRAELLSRGAKLRTRSDAELVLRAYEAWGEDCPKHIDGEFAFVIWDARRNEAYCARDHAGTRPLHYHWNGQQLVVASDIAGVLAGPGVVRRSNRGMIAEIIANECLTRDETVWLGVMRGLGAHTMAFGPRGLRTNRYWSPPEVVSIVYKTDEEYFEHYRALLDDCVRRYSRSHRPIACDVSGGLDSSAIFCVAHGLLESGNLSAPGVNGYTFLSEAGSPADEIEYARAVANHVGAKLTEVTPFMPDRAWFDQRVRDDCDAAPFPNGAMATNLGRALTADGCRVSLNGEGGDEWLGGRRWYYAEQLSDRDWRQLWLSIRRDVAECGLRQTAWWVLRFGLIPMLPRAVLDLRRKLRPAKQVNTFKQLYWMSKDLETIWIERRATAETRNFLAIGNLARRAMSMVLNDPFGAHLNDHQSRQSARGGYEDRMPMYARAFLEFAFSTPEHIRLRGKRTKFIHVNALAGVIPDVVAKRQTKADFSLAFTRHLDKMEAVFVEELARSATGNLDAGGMRRLFDFYREAPYDRKPIWELWGIYLGEMLIRSFPD